MEETAILSGVYECLLYNPPGTTDIIPWLATSWEMSDDGKDYTFHLREGVKFHDGTPFNATAVKVSLERTEELGEGRRVASVENIESMEIVDTYTITIHLYQPVSYFLASQSLIGEACGIVSPTAVKKHSTPDDPFAATWLADNAVGTGPYYLETWEREEYFILKKFDDYWRGWEGKHVDIIVGKFVKEFATRRMMLLAQEVDIAETLTPEDVDIIKDVPGIETMWQGTPQYSTIWMNMLGVLEDIKLRKMLTYVYDYEAAFEGIYLGHAIRARSPVTSGMFGFNEELPLPERNVTKAQELLADAGYSPGELTLTLLYNVGWPWKEQVAELLKSNLAEIGVSVEIEKTVWPEMWAAMTNPEAPYDLYPFFTGTTLPDPYLTLSVYHSDHIRLGGTNKGFNVTEFDELYKEGMSLTDRTEYEEAIKRMQELIIEEVPHVWLVELMEPKCWWHWVKGFPAAEFRGDFTEFNYWDMYIEGRD